MVGGEDEDPLAPAARPQPVGEVQQAGKGDRIHPVLAGGAAHFVWWGAATATAGGGTGLFPVPEVDGAVDVLNHDYRFRAGFHQKLPELGIRVDLRQLQIVDVVAEEIGHGGDHAGFSGAGRAVEEVPSLPGAAGFLVERLPVGEVSQIFHDLRFHGGIHRQSIERAGMLERHRLPWMAAGIERSAAGVGVEEPLLVFPADFAGPVDDEVEV